MAEGDSDKRLYQLSLQQESKLEKWNREKDKLTRKSKVKKVALQQIAMKMLRDDIPLHTIVNVTGLTNEEVEKLKKINDALS